MGTPEDTTPAAPDAEGDVEFEEGIEAVEPDAPPPTMNPVPH